MDKNEFCSVYNMHIVTDNGLEELRHQMETKMCESEAMGRNLGRYEHILERLEEVEEILKHLHTDIEYKTLPVSTAEQSAEDNAMTWLSEAIVNVNRAKENITEANKQLQKSVNSNYRKLKEIIDLIGV
jgi:hypothetical protein